MFIGTIKEKKAQFTNAQTGDAYVITRDDTITKATAEKGLKKEFPHLKNMEVTWIK